MRDFGGRTRIGAIAIFSAAVLAVLAQSIRAAVYALSSHKGVPLQAALGCICTACFTRAA